jgi:hypothetical protein
MVIGRMGISFNLKGAKTGRDTFDPENGNPSFLPPCSAPDPEIPSQIPCPLLFLFFAFCDLNKDSNTR